tara:strand:+ start:722 stop:1042 length:321 start_codon:yes stop_codon:yes gene_type:complete
MREIKFRAFQDQQMLISPISSNYGLLRFFGMLYEDAKLMQFTGLQDKNGVDIYEGDLLEFDGGNKLAVSFEDGGFGCFDNSYQFLPLFYWNMSLAEVVGNIYENNI